MREWPAERTDGYGTIASGFEGIFKVLGTLYCCKLESVILVAALSNIGIVMIQLPRCPFWCSEEEQVRNVPPVAVSPRCYLEAVHHRRIKGSIKGMWRDIDDRCVPSGSAAR